MRAHILDLDGSLPLQTELMRRYRPNVAPAEAWGPRVRMACSFGRYRRFERFLAAALDRSEHEPALTLYGSGDFHHVTLALLRRQPRPFNLLVLDNHPDWMGGVPLLHCGTWLWHAARLPQVRRIIHVGGEVDFDNAYRWLAPWSCLRSGKITVFPALRRYARGRWRAVPTEALRNDCARPIAAGDVQDLLRPLRADLARFPLYVSLDKDVMRADDAAVNWDSGHLTLAEVCTLLHGFLRTAGGRLAGMDLLGDWSPVKVRGLLRRLLHATEHPRLAITPAEAARRNERANLAILEAVSAASRAEATTRRVG